MTPHLKQGDKQIKSFANKVGKINAKWFNDVFKKRHCVPPKKINISIRKINQKGEEIEMNNFTLLPPYKKNYKIIVMTELPIYPFTI